MIVWTSLNNNIDVDTINLFSRIIQIQIKLYLALDYSFVA